MGGRRRRRRRGPNGRKVIYTRWDSARSDPPFGKALFAVDIDGKNDHQVASWELGGGDHAVFSPRGSILLRSFEGDEAASPTSGP